MKSSPRCATLSASRLAMILSWSTSRGWSPSKDPGRWLLLLTLAGVDCRNKNRGRTVTTSTVTLGIPTLWNSSTLSSRSLHNQELWPWFIFWLFHHEFVLYVIQYCILALQSNKVSTVKVLTICERLSLDWFWVGNFLKSRSLQARYSELGIFEFAFSTSHLYLAWILRYSC